MKNVFITLIMLFVSSSLWAAEPVSKSYFSSVAIGGMDTTAYHLPIDGIFTANTTHIMQREDAKLMMQTIAKNLPAGGVFCQYGPMNVNGEYTSKGNRDFDQHLAESGCGGICDIAELSKWADGMELVDQIPMPANNFLLVWKVI